MADGKACSLACMAFRCGKLCDEEKARGAPRARPCRWVLGGALDARFRPHALLAFPLSVDSSSLLHILTPQPPKTPLKHQPPHTTHQPPTNERAPQVLALIGPDAPLASRYSRDRLQSYLEDNARVRFCPSAPWCGRCIEVRARP